MGWARTPLERAALTVCVVLTACAFFQEPVVLEPTNIDDSWLYALTHAAVRGVRFGDDIVFNYGPLGWVMFPYAEPAWLRWELFTNLLVSAVFVSVTFATARRLSPWPITLFFVAWLALGSALLRGLPFHLAPALVTLLAVRSLPRVSGWLPAAVVILGVGSLVKLTLLGLAVPCVAAIAWAAGRHGLKRLALGCVLGYLLVYGLGWVALGQSVGGFVRFHRLGLELVLGHSDGMAQAEAAAAWAPLALVATTSALALVSARSGVSRPSGPPLLLAVLATVFIVWRQAYIRADSHRLELFALLPLLAVALPAPSSRHVVRALRVAALSLCAYGMATILPLYGSWRQLAEAWPAKMGYVAHWLLDEPALRGELDEAAREAAAREGLPRVRRRVGRATIDLAPSTVGIVFVNDLTWHPRPCFDGRLSYRGALYDANHAFLRSEQAPRFLLVRPSQADDGLLPASVGAASLRAALERYEPRLEDGAYVLGERRDRPLDLGAADAGRTVSARMGEDVPVDGSADDLVWMSLVVHRTALGWLRGLLVRPRPVYLVVRAGDDERRFRVVPGMVERPVLLSPLLGGGDNVMDLTHPDRLASMPVVESVRVETDDRWDYADQITLSLVRARGARARLVAPWDAGEDEGGAAVGLGGSAATGPGRCDGREAFFAGGAPLTIALDEPSRVSVPFGFCGSVDDSRDAFTELSLWMERDGHEVALRRVVLRGGEPLAPRELHAVLFASGPTTLRLRARVDDALRGRVVWRAPVVEAAPQLELVSGAPPDGVVSSFPIDPVACGGVPASSLHAPGDAVFARPPGTYRVTGLVGTCPGNQSDGLGFSVGARGDGGLRAVWGREVDPAAARAGARLRFDATVTLGAGDAIVVHADPAGRPDGDWGWVGGVSIEPAAPR